MTTAEQNASNNHVRLTDARRVVVKIGSSLLIDKVDGSLNKVWLESLAAELAAMIKQGQQVMLVSSGAIALGRPYLGMGPEQRRLEQHQAAAAAGQVLLAHAYQELMALHACKVAQILLTPDDTEDRRRYLNGRNTMETLLGLGVLPVINENDSVATEEIRYGDNDRLAARVAEMVSADCLVLLSDVDGMYDADPTINTSAQLIEEVREITPDLAALAGESQTAYGSGGMATKLAAARICMSAGCATVIASGHEQSPLSKISSGARCTWFIPSSTPLAARKQWIAGTLTAKGKLIVDSGAETALDEGKSLLPIGVKQVVGDFDRGDAVTIVAADGRDIGRGLAAHSSAEAAQIIGRHSDEIAEHLGYASRSEIVHRDNLVLLDNFKS
jgi:glutamate 5-kinase